MQKAVLFIAVFLFLSPSFSKADTKKEIAKCAALKGEGARLVCYDQLAKKLGVDTLNKKQHGIVGKGKWDVDDKINPVDDSRLVVLFLQADTGESKLGEKILMMVRCQSNKTELIIGWNDYLGGEAEVLTRIGKEKAVTKNWSMSSSKTASFYPGSPIFFLQKMMKHDSLLAQVTPYNESPVTAIFDIKGLSNAIKPLRDACRWKDNASWP